MKSESQIMKDRLRSHFLEIRNRISPEKVLKKSALITDQLMDLDHYRWAHVIHSYVSMPHRNEVFTHAFIKKTLMVEKTVLVPKMNEEGNLSSEIIFDFDELAPNQWGVLEPAGKGMKKLPEIDLVIVPMVAGDHQKNRLGYGMGYYDRFLSGVRAFKIGLLFHCQLYDERLPAEDFDVSLDMLITESGII